jgi:hypothetical protein
MFKLDRNFHRTYNQYAKQREVDNYAEMSFEEKARVFAYLQSVAYNYTFGFPPKMDKTIHSQR